jgi:hypothetical protein
MRSRSSKSKREAQTPDNNKKAQQWAMVDNDDASEFQSTHSLLLSCLRYWEVERDLIEERLAAVRSGR